MFKNKIRFYLVLTMVIMAIFFLSGLIMVEGSGKQEVPKIPKVEVRIGMAPFGDQTWAIIGMKQGWFEDAGIIIDPKPYGKVIPSEQRTAVMIAGTVDIMTGHAGSLLPVLKDAPNLKFFFGSNTFLGFAIVARSDMGYKSYKEFLKEEKDPEKAMQKTMAQLKGKVYAYAQIPANIAFVEQSLKKAGLSLDDVKSMVLEDSKIIAMMLTGRADFATTGAPSRMQLETKGYKPIFTAEDMATMAKASPASDELQGVLVAGWCTTDQFLKNNHDTVLRLCSVFYRIIDFMDKNQKDAIKLHLPYLNSVSGQNMTEEGLKFLYDSLNPFVTFEKQASWYENPNDPFYYKNELGSKIRDWVEKGVYKQGEITENSVTVAPQLYYEMKELKKKADNLMAEVKSAKKFSRETKDLLTKAEYYYNAYNYLDSVRFAEAAKKSL